MLSKLWLIENSRYCIREKGWLISELQGSNKIVQMQLFYVKMNNLSTEVFPISPIQFPASRIQKQASNIPKNRFNITILNIYRTSFSSFCSVNI